MTQSSFRLGLRRMVQSSVFLSSKRKKYNFDRERLWVSQNGVCHWCKKLCVKRGSGGNKDEFTVDHIVPLKCNGTNHWMNLVGSCFECNRKREIAWRKIEPRVIQEHP